MIIVIIPLFDVFVGIVNVLQLGSIISLICGKTIIELNIR
jgi:hypothetical protein